MTPDEIKELAEGAVRALPLGEIDGLWSKPGAAEALAKTIHDDDGSLDHARLIAAIREAAHWRRFRENNKPQY